MKPISYKVPKLKITIEKGRPLGGFGWPKSHFRATDSPLSVIPDKKTAILLKLNIPKSTWKVPLGQPTLNQQKAKLKLVKKGKKGTKESKLSLGSWLAI